MLAEQHRAVFISGHAVGAVVSARWQITSSVITARIENLRHFSVRRPLTHHVTDHVPITRVAVEVDPARFFKMFIARLTGGA